jgi:hypothetical protein
VSVAAEKRTAHIHHAISELPLHDWRKLVIDSKNISAFLKVEGDAKEFILK